MIKYLYREKGFVSLIGMLVALGLICWLAYYLLNSYFKPSKVLPEAGPEGGKVSASYNNIVSDARDKVNQINKKSQGQSQQLEEMNK
jgi:hypothetical protein